MLHPKCAATRLATCTVYSSAGAFLAGEAAATAVHTVPQVRAEVISGSSKLDVFRNAGIFHQYKEPVMLTEGKMQYLFDETGRRYLDVRN